MITVSANNGKAPASALSVIPGSNGDGSPHTTPHTTAQSYARLRAAMQAAGLGDLLPSSGWSCYRDRAAQQHMRDIGLTTIPVGQSIHGEWTYGSAVDFANLGGFGATRHNWLKANGGAFGWYQPGWATAGGSLPEPWHWEYDERGDSHAGEEPDMPLSDEDLRKISDITQGTADSAIAGRLNDIMNTVWARQVSRVDGFPTTILQDTVDGTTASLNTWDRVQDVPPPSAHGTRRVDLFVFAVVALLAIVIGVSVALLGNNEDDGVAAGLSALVGGFIATVLRNLSSDR